MALVLVQAKALDVARVAGGSRAGRSRGGEALPALVHNSLSIESTLQVWALGFRTIGQQPGQWLGARGWLPSCSTGSAPRPRVPNGSAAHKPRRDGRVYARTMRA